MNIRNALAAIAVSDLGAAIAWYERLIGRPPDERPIDGLAEWSFAKGGWIQIFRDAERAGSSSVTLVEADLEERLADLETKNIAILATSRSAHINFAVVEDPDGNQLVFAEGLTPTHRAAAAGADLVWLPFKEEAAHHHA